MAKRKPLRLWSYGIKRFLVLLPSAEPGRFPR